MKMIVMMRRILNEYRLLVFTIVYGIYCRKVFYICKNTNMRLVFCSRNKLNNFIKVHKDVLSKFCVVYLL